MTREELILALEKETALKHEAGKKLAEAQSSLLKKDIENKKLESIIIKKDELIIKQAELLKLYNIDKYINTIVFHNENKIIDELYIPLTIVHNNKRDKIVLNKSMKNIFNSPIKYLIIDTAGTGKSTLVKFLSTHCVENEWAIPFVIELRRMERNQSIEEFILNDVKLVCKTIEFVDIKDLLRRGNFIFFLDGYDEIL